MRAKIATMLSQVTQTGTRPHEQESYGRSLETWLFICLIAALAIAPLPLGSNRPLPFAILSAVIGFLLVIWAGTVIFGQSKLSPHIARISWALILYFVVCIWVFVQYLPLPFSGPIDPIWSEAAKILATDIQGHISVNPESTLSGLLHLLTYAAIFWLSFNLAADSRRARLGVRAMAFIAAAYGIYGIVIFLTGNEWILTYRKWAYQESLSSTFVNRNSYATYAGLGLLCAIVVLLERLHPLIKVSMPARTKIVMLVEEISTRSVWITSLTVTSALALFLSASRAGVAASVVAAICLIIVTLPRTMRRKAPLAALTIAFFVFICGMYLAGGGTLSKRLSANRVGDSVEVRGEIYEITLSAIATSPWNGTGYGTYADVIPAYRSTGSASMTKHDKAHNTYLENALELGIPAAALLNLAVLLLAIRTARGAWERQREKLLPALGLAATILVGLHGLVDFSLQIPAVTATYAFIMGVSVSQSWSRRDK